MNYEVKIREASFELSARDRLRFKDTSTAIDLNASVDDTTAFVITNPKGYVILDIHNEKSKDNPDYVKYIVVDEAGNTYMTGSHSFWNSFKEIFDEMGTTSEGYSIEVMKIESNNYKGKSFLKCVIC